MKLKTILGDGVIIFASLLTLFAVSNVVIHFAIGAISPMEEHINRRVDIAAMREQIRLADPKLLFEAYGRDVNAIVDIIGDQSKVFPVYQEFIQFKMPEVETDTFNYDQAGFRRNETDQASWPPSSDVVNIFVFGGSTTMGSGVPDGETWPQFLQTMLAQQSTRKIAVYNFGQPAHFSSQEVAHFEQLLRQGHVPDAAIFLDGLNEMIMQEGIPAWTGFLRDSADRLHTMWHRDDPWTHAKAIAGKLPIASLIRKIHRKPPSPAPSMDVDAPAYRNERNVLDAWARYKVNRRIASALGREFDISMVFSWQPTPYYNYPRMDDVLTMLESWEPMHRGVLRVKYGYERMNSEIAQDFLARPNRVWCADAFANSDRLLFVDHAHYNALGNKIVAGCLVDAITERGLIPRLEPG